MRKIALAVALCGGLLTTPALAEPQTQEIVVSTINRSAGDVRQLPALESDLREAARTVCSVGRVNRGPMDDRQKVCFRKAMLDARDQLVEFEQRQAIAQGG
ncbi:MAG: hypothetical protein CL820_07440 [Croceicoccus sp.]|nr:hypothetical protein [Croceicoccus sp.]MAL25717.1 hypothetical protein [Croceicoccus sp.]|tara:strand:- start:2385 stop:2687 length:303 start_codon:yes stop_codon:yes gene_type:complete